MVQVFGWFLAGAAGGALCDQIHVRGGVLRYRTPRVFDQAWWVAPQFGVAMLAVLRSARVAAGDGRGRPGSVDYLTGTAWFLGAYLASAVFRRTPRLLAGVFLATWLARMARRPDRGRLVPYALMLALAGTTYESRWSATGAFTYTAPDVAGVPLWLPGLYLHGAPLGVDVARGQRVER
ncbi:MAG: hypothetical protein QOJ09_742 [Actinomycetota bacterium]|nr:hypothetical protein [Actinomycetota bacterium]